MSIYDPLDAKNKSAQIRALIFLLTFSVLALMIELTYQYTFDIYSKTHSVVLQSIANQLSLASAVNFISRSADKSKGIAINNCQDVLQLMNLNSSAFNQYEISTIAKSENGKDCKIRFIKANLTYYFYSNKIS